MLIYEIIDNIGDISSYWDHESDAILAFDPETDDSIRVRELNAFEIYTAENFHVAVRGLEEQGVSRAAIARALNISRWTLNRWMDREPTNLKPSQMIALLHLEQAFN